MSLSLRQPTRWPRSHGEVLEPSCRRRLERLGWRTTLDFRENHVRARNGQLISVTATWTAEAERCEHGLAVVSATAQSPEEAWSAVLGRVESGQWTYIQRRVVTRRAVG